MGSETSIDLQSENIGFNVFPNERSQNLFTQGCAWNTLGEVNSTKPLDDAILKLLHKSKIDYNKIRDEHLIPPFSRFLEDSKRKNMSTVLKNIKDSSTMHPERIHIRGDAESILNFWSFCINDQGEREPLTGDIAEYIIKNVINEFSSNGLKSFWFAYKDLKENEGGKDHDNNANDKINKEVEIDGLTCIAILGIKYSLRPEIPEALNFWQKEGIKVRIFTDENSILAAAIAKECNLLKENKEDRVIEGPELNRKVKGIYWANWCYNLPWECRPDEVQESVYDFTEFVEVMKSVTVISRWRYEDKHLVVAGLKKQECKIAITGNWAEEARALDLSHLGIWMGLKSDNISKFNSSVILHDESLTVIMKLLMIGRNIYSNIRRCIQFQWTCTIVTLLTILIGSCILREIVLMPIQLIWIYIIITILVPFALSSCPPNVNLFLPASENNNKSIISRKVIKHVLIMSIYQLAVMIVLIFAGEEFIPESTSYFPRQSSNMIVSGRGYKYGGKDDYLQYSHREEHWV